MATKSAAPSGRSNLAVNQLDVYGRVILHFDPTKKPYTELQWMDDSTGLVMSQIVAHTKGADGTMHNHLSFYTHEVGQPNARKHHMSLHWVGDGKDNVLQLDSVRVADYHNDTPVQRYWVSPSGQAWLVGIDDQGNFTKTKATLPAQSG